MSLALVAALEILGLVLAVLAIVGVPLAMGVLAYELVVAHREEARAAAASRVITAAEIGSRNVAPLPSRRLSA